MQRFQLSSRRFEGHTVLGDCVNGWMKKDTKGRPHLRIASPSGQEYCHSFQQPGKECQLPCPHACLHEKVPERLRQHALRRQGFKGKVFTAKESGASRIWKALVD